ncbi:hypothetical protein J1605_015280 [Eschrichtius robustus]|uniref:Uncharacterized protein n=1 Tax=Eschrichtius robustus TaxID=9764 RepID=A0AB34GCY1_ESCRO|nr:hypothetical protein J1605_015280 [Eschrichtius robustus]
MIAVGSDDSSPNAMAKVQIFEYNENTRKYAKAETLLTVTDPVHDIAFAPNLGRSFHILAIATKDVRIFTLKPVRIMRGTGESNESDMAHLSVSYGGWGGGYGYDIDMVCM